MVQDTSADGDVSGLDAAPTPDGVRRHAWLTGQVQGVWFRRSTANEAARIGGLEGWVRNLPDGRVELVVEGDAAAVERLLAWCQAGGPPQGRVDAMDVIDEPYTASESGFEVRR